MASVLPVSGEEISNDLNPVADLGTAPQWFHFMKRRVSQRATRGVSFTRKYLASEHKKDATKSSISYSVPLDGDTCTVTLDSEKAHVLTWSFNCDELGGNESALQEQSHTELQLPPEGACSLYSYPKISTTGNTHESDGGSLRKRMPSAAGICMLDEILVWLATNTEALDSTDEVGAYPIHTLAVGNNARCLDLVERLCKISPKMLAFTHAAGQPFAGETILHVLAANRHEDLLIKFVRMAATDLPEKEFAQLLKSKTTGNFFLSLPMRHFEGTVLSFACCFGLQRAVRCILNTGHLSLNRQADVSNSSGFMPLHSLIAWSCCTRSQLAMYEYLTNQLPYEHRASTSIPTGGGMVDTYIDLLPVQLAAALGNQALVRHMLRSQAEVVWTWGPVTQYSLNLKEIDSANVGSGDIMELIVRHGATKRTTEMILETFMNGFLFQLYRKKWAMYGWQLHYSRLLLDVLLMLSLSLQTILLKQEPLRLTRAQPQSVAHVCVVVFDVFVELLSARLFMRNAQVRRGDVRIGMVSLVCRTWSFVQAHTVHVLLLSHCFTFGGCIMILGQYMPDPQCASVVSDWFDGGTATDVNESGVHCNLATNAAGVSGHGRQLKSSYSREQTETFLDYPIYDEGSWALLWLLNAVAIGLLMLHLAVQISRPFETFSVLLSSIYRIIVTDFATFASAFMMLLYGFIIVLFTLYPRSGEHSLPFASQFNELHTALIVLLDLGLVAERVPFETLPTSYGALSNMQLICLALWVGLYYAYLICCAVLLLNLFIAMLSNTFAEVMSDATLTSRLELATSITKMELLATWLGMNVHVGDRTPSGSYVYTWRAVDEDSISNEQDEHLEFAQDPFAAPKSTQLTLIQKELQRINATIGAGVQADHSA